MREFPHITEDGNVAFFDANANLLGTQKSSSGSTFVQISGEYAVAANRDEAVIRVLKLENHPEAQAFAYDGTYAHTEARLGDDGTTAMLYSPREFRIYALDGTVVADVTVSEASNVYDQQYRRSEDGSYLEVIYNDGLIRCYSATDGTLISETAGPAPDGSLRQEFDTDQFHIVAEAHGAPVVYDRASGEQVALLETDDYLTYVTQVGTYIVTEYVTAEDGSRYGLLLDGELNILADLPGLCDILPDGTLLFDDMRGNLRSSPIYTLDQLRAMGAAV